MKPSVLIVGAGLSGLAAAWHLHRRGIDFKLIEARARVGGRAFTQSSSHGDFDLGPSWVWRGQPHVSQLLQHFSIASYDQFCDGVLLHQSADGQVQQNPYMKPMQYAQRLEGGVASLCNALLADLPSERVILRCKLLTLEQTAGGVRASMRNADGELQECFSSVALALPPRLASELSIAPELPPIVGAYLKNTPTWMAAQAKFFSVYKTPFWRRAGFSGDAFSATGVLAEIHDACKVTTASADGDFHALFGFVRYPADVRATMGESSICDQALQQLAHLFGDAALAPLKTYLKDWSADALTAAPTDAIPLSRHPQYGACPDLGKDWQNKLHFIGAETSAGNGGLVEGALQRGREFAATVA